MAVEIQSLFIDPPIAIARLGAATKPVDCFVWEDAPDPHLQTVIAPAWSLDVETDGTVVPRMPDQLRFRDGDLIRPVAPFFEVWALVKRDGNAELTETPLTPALLEQNGVKSLTLTIDARNAKAAHRANRADLEFGTFPPVTVEWTNHASVPLIGKCRQGIARPMVPDNSPGIPLGRVQFMRSQKQPTSLEPWLKDVNVEVLRFRFTPAQGLFYGPPESARVQRHGLAPVLPQNAFLDGDAGWSGVRVTPNVEPADTFDATETGASLGVVDDTCTANLELTLVLEGKDGAAERTLHARSHVSVAPPHFAPDRRPFLSLADELIDRSYQGQVGVKPDDDWARDLFERVYETASLMNLDAWRAERAAQLSAAELTKPGIRGDGVLEPDRAMGGHDRLRNPEAQIDKTSDKVPLPLSQRAKERHRNLAELEELRTLILRDHGRIKQLVRPPFHVANNEDGGASTMQMPPFMRNSNAFPLTLASWQYDVLLRWVDQVIAAAKKQAPTMSPSATQRRAAVLARLRNAQVSSGSAPRRRP